MREWHFSQINGQLSFLYRSMTNSSTPEEEKEESTMIDPGIGKEISKMNFESDEIDEQPVSHSLSFYRFVEGFPYFLISNFGCIDVILSPEYLFAEVSELWSCFESSLNLIFSWKTELTFLCDKEAMIMTVKSMSLMNAKNGTDYYQILSECSCGHQSESWMDRKRHFCLSAFLIEEREF
jgi:hypothetical protein